MGIANTLQKKRNVARTVDLLAGAAVLTENQVREATALVNETRQPIERVLVEFHFVSPEVMQATVRLQLMSSESMLPNATALKALALIRRSNLTVREALALLGWGNREDRSDNELGKFLLEASLISEQTYEQALRKSRQDFCSFGSFLVLKSLLSCNVLNASLQALALVMQGKLSRAKALAMAKFAYSSGLSIWEALTEAGFSTDYITNCQLSLGELLSQAGLVSESDKAALVEFSIIEKKRLGDLMVNQGLTSHRILQSALVLQKLARARVISRREACQILKAASSEGHDLRSELLSRFGQGEKQLAIEAVELLLQAGIISISDTDSAVNQADVYGIDVLRGLVMADVIDGQLMEAVRDLMLRLRLNLLSESDAVRALHHCDRGRCNLDSALKYMSQEDKETTEKAKYMERIQQLEDCADAEPPAIEAKAGMEIAGRFINFLSNLTKKKTGVQQVSKALQHSCLCAADKT